MYCASCHCGMKSTLYRPIILPCMSASTNLSNVCSYNSNNENNNDTTTTTNDNDNNGYLCSANPKLRSNRKKSTVFTGFYMNTCRLSNPDASANVCIGRHFHGLYSC